MLSLEHLLTTLYRPFSPIFHLPRHPAALQPTRSGNHSPTLQPTPASRPSGSPQRVLLIGANNVSAQLAAALQEQTAGALMPVALLDDDPMKQGIKLCGVPVRGRLVEVAAVVRDCKVHLVVFAQPAASGAVIRSVWQQCVSIGIPLLVLPATASRAGQAMVTQLHKVQLDDLLRCEPTNIDLAGIAALLRGRRVLVTGAGGCVGRELCRQVLACAPSALIVLGRGENSVLDCVEDLRELRQPPHRSPTQIQPIIADVRFRQCIDSVFAASRPDVVFHAAVHKHAPYIAKHPGEAVTNNVLGAWNVLRAAAHTGVERFVLLSTTHAARPISIAGATMRVAEMLVHRYAHTPARTYLAVRFGDVLGASGGAVQMMMRQIAAGGPVAISHPDARRLLVPEREAVQLTLHAATLGTGGEVFTLDLGESAPLAATLRDLIALAGYPPGHEVAIQYVGLPVGERLHEELFVPGQNYIPTSHANIYQVSLPPAWAPSALETALGKLLAAAAADAPAAIREHLHRLAPDCVTTTS